MMDPYDRFELAINERVVKTPIALASMAGVVDAPYVLEREEHAGMAFLGGFSIDEVTMAASRVLADEGRSEFLYDDPVQALKEQAELLGDTDIVCGLNLRGSMPESYAAIAKVFGRRFIYEIDAHCRQKAMTDAGCGEYLLQNDEKLAETIRALKAEDVTVSVKIRAGVHKNDVELARLIWKAGADIIHIDLMDSGYAKLRQIRNACPLILIANNSITTPSVMKELLSHGADLVSLARQADNTTLAGLDEAVTEMADEVGWYNAPKQLCRGGDIRSLAFCCMPVKNCPLLPTLERLGLPRNEYVVTKQQAVAGTPLEGGERTCFGSLAFCCKSSTPCMFRDMSLQKAGLSHSDYMRYKHRLSEKVMARVFNAVPSGDKN